MPFIPNLVRCTGQELIELAAQMAAVRNVPPQIFYHSHERADPALISRTVVEYRRRHLADCLHMIRTRASAFRRNHMTQMFELLWQDQHLLRLDAVMPFCHLCEVLSDIRPMV